MNENIANSFSPAKTLALKYTGSEVLSNCTKIALSFKAARKKQEEQEEIRKSTVAQERTENSPQGK